MHQSFDHQHNCPPHLHAAAVSCFHGDKKTLDCNQRGNVQEDRCQVEGLRAKIRDVRESILDLVVRMEYILLRQIPQILSDHALKVGCLEQALLDAELEARRARKRLTLAQAQANRGIVPDLTSIELQLDTEFADWMVKVKAAHEQYERALAYHISMTPMNESEANKIKGVYRTLVKRLHPDVRPKDDGERAPLFAIAQAAYRTGDISTLQSLEVATRHLDPAFDDLEATSDVDLLAQELELARIEENVTRGRLRELEEGEVMLLGRLLADPKWLTRRTTELRQAIEEWEDVRRTCDERLRKLMEDVNGN